MVAAYRGLHVLENAPDQRSSSVCSLFPERVHLELQRHFTRRSEWRIAVWSGSPGDCGCHSRHQRCAPCARDGQIALRRHDRIRSTPRSTLPARGWPRIASVTSRAARDDAVSPTCRRPSPIPTSWRAARLHARERNCFPTIHAGETAASYCASSPGTAPARASGRSPPRRSARSSASST